MAIKIAINGFGRIGRNVTRLLFANNAKPTGIEVVAINDLTDPKTLAHLFKYDSVHGAFKGTVSAVDGGLNINGSDIKIFSEKDPSKLPWKQLGVDIVYECTGIFTKKKKLSFTFRLAQRKLSSQLPPLDPDATLCYGVNHTTYNPATHNIVSNASCTTNCLAPMAKVIHENFGIVKGMMTTIHSYTNDQQILDLPTRI